MTANTERDVPQWFVYNEQDELDIQATLKAVPEEPERGNFFFRQVPDWFEAGSAHLGDIQEGLERLDNMTPEEKLRYTETEVEDMKAALKRVMAHNRLMLTPGLTDNQKEFVRCLCYWSSLEAMNSVPITEDEAEDIF